MERWWTARTRGKWWTSRTRDGGPLGQEWEKKTKPSREIVLQFCIVLLEKMED